MYYINLFIISMIEIICLMILWCSLDKEFFKRKDKYFYKRILIIFITSFFTTLMDKLNLQLGLVFNFIFFIVSISIIFNRKFLLCLAEFCIVTLSVFLLQFILATLFKFTAQTLDLSSNFINILLMNLLLMLACLYIFYVGLLRKLIDVLQQNISTFYFVVFNILFYLVVAKWFVKHENPLFGDSLPLFIIAPLLFMIGNFAYTHYSIKLKEQAKALETYNRYVPIITQLLDETRRRQHDFKNHLNTINGIIQYSEDVEGKTLVKEYVNSLNSSFTHLESLIHIENKVLAAIIYNKIIDADRLNINFKYKVHHPFTALPLKDYELSEVLNNLLDNAFEAVMHNDDIKQVHFNFCLENNNLIIEVGNTGKPIEPSLINRIFHKGFTTKNEKGHGYGLYTVKKIVETYKGTMELSYERSCNIFKVLFHF